MFVKNCLHQIVFHIYFNFFVHFNLLKKIIGVFYNKYLFTVNHKKIGLMYLIFSLLMAICGTYLATCIRLELAYPGSGLLGGDSLKYLRLISIHALIMIFFVVIPVFFGGFANILIPHHIGSKDVAFPRLNSLGFWLQPCGFSILVRVSTQSPRFWNDLESKEAAYLFRNFLKVHPVNRETRNIDQMFSYHCKNITTLKKSFIKYVINKQELVNEKSTLINIKHDLIVNYLLSKKDIKINLYKIFKLNDKTPKEFRVFFWDSIFKYSEQFVVEALKQIKVQLFKRFAIETGDIAQTLAGWSMITPMSSKLLNTSLGAQDMVILAIYYVGLSTTISVLNLLTTRRAFSGSGLRTRRFLLPFTTISLLLTLRTLIIITPILGAAMLMLLCDRHCDTSFFDFTNGGDPLFFQHLFWFFGHPEVYVLVIPAFGIINSILPTISLRKLASKNHLIWAVYTMNYMGFLVWGHHLYLIGLDHRSRALYSTITIMISLPATIKLVNWTYTLLNGYLRNTILLYIIISFMLFFIVGGLTGMWLSHVSLNISMHDTLYVVAHFHLMLSGAVILGIFAGFYFYYYTFFQRKFSRLFSFIHIFYYSTGQWLTFIPLFWLAFSGLPRRVHDFPFIFVGWQSASTAGHFVTLVGVLAFYFGLLESSIEGKVVKGTFSIFRPNKLYLLFPIKLVHLAVNRMFSLFRINSAVRKHIRLNFPLY